ncbi:hypothetical protein HDV00_008939 [Rhizophlyctis rosea]|nr:hypothetical protein HDV00_008939 [Rhizophlyctis rosea]
MYLKTDGDVVEDPDITREEVAMLENDEGVARILRRGRGDAGDESGDSDDSSSTDQGVPARILDLCCGQGRHSLHLAQKYPHLRLHGHDQSSYLISLAKERAIAQKLNSQTTFTVGDCRQIPYPDAHFDLVLVMGNSFGYFATDDADSNVLSEIARILAPGGRLVLDLTDGNYMRENFAERSWEWIDDETFVCRERQLSKDNLRLNSREVVNSTSKGVIRDQFYQERLYSRKELDLLMRESGLQMVVAGGKPEMEITVGKEMSKRNEDLGMMEQRMLVMAVKPVPRDDDESSSSSTGFDAADGTAQTNGEGKSYRFPNGVVHAVMNGKLDSLSSSPSPVPPITLHRQLEDDELPPFTNMVVLLGDPTKPCVGKLNDTWNEEDFQTRDKLLNALYELGYPKDTITVLDHHESFHRTLAECPPPFVFNLCDEGFHNDALKELHVPAMLDMLQIPYSGAGPNCLAYCYDKGLVNRTADALGVPTPRETFFFANAANSIVSDMSRLHDTIETRIKYPAFIKPVKGDNSLGITARSIVRNRTDLDSYMAELRSIGIRDVIVQEYLQGTEYGIGMIGNPSTGFHFFPILEIDYSRIVSQSLPPILGFESKWDPQSPYWSEISYRRANLPTNVEEDLKRHCLTLWDRFGCRDYARFDFRCDIGRGDGRDGKGGVIKLLEVNPNPGWCWDGKLAYMGKLEGRGYKDLLAMILRASWERIAVEENGKGC